MKLLLTSIHKNDGEYHDSKTCSFFELKYSDLTVSCKRYRIGDKRDFHWVAQVGDVLAYKLVELTASWTPELSAYRVRCRLLTVN